MKKLIFLLAISFIFFSCKKEEPVTPDLVTPVNPITTGTLDVNFKNKLVNVELQQDTTKIEYDSTRFTIKDVSQYEHIATIKDIQSGKYKCKLTHRQKNQQGEYQLYYYTIRDSVDIQVDKITTVKSIY